MIEFINQIYVGQKIIQLKSSVNINQVSDFFV
jgi:hypothetical protein